MKSSEHYLHRPPQCEANTTNTTRTLKNINVSRVLNFVFRQMTQMTQEHTVVIHLTDASLGYYPLDLLLGADGNPMTGLDGDVITRGPSPNTCSRRSPTS